MNSAESLLQLEEKIQKEKDNTVKYILLHDLAIASVEEEKLDYAFQVYKEALNVARKMHKVKLECETLIHLGDVADELYNANPEYHYPIMDPIMDEIGLSDLAAYFYHEALTLAEKTKSFRVQSRILRKLAALSARNGNLELAAEYYKQAADAARIADSRRVREEQTTNKPVPSKIARGSSLSRTIQKSIEVSNQIKQTERLRTYQRYVPIVVANFIIIILIVIGYNIFSKTVSSPVIYLVFGMSILIGIYTLYILIRNLVSHFVEN